MLPTFPSFAAFLTANQNLTQNVDDPILGYTERYDIGGGFDAVAGTWTTPVLPGGRPYTVALTFGSRVITAGVGNFGAGWLYKNGAQFALGIRWFADAAASNAQFAGFTAFDRTTGGDVYQARIFTSASTAGPIATTTGTGAFTWFMGGLMGIG